MKSQPFPPKKLDPSVLSNWIGYRINWIISEVQVGKKFFFTFSASKKLLAPLKSRIGTWLVFCHSFSVSPGVSQDQPFDGWYRGGMVHHCYFKQLNLSKDTDCQGRHKSKKSEKFGWCGRQDMLWPYLKICNWDLIFSHAVKVVLSPCPRALKIYWVGVESWGFYVAPKWKLLIMMLRPFLQRSLAKPTLVYECYAVKFAWH